MSLENYLKQHLAKGTAVRYKKEINRYIEATENPITAGVKEVVDYIGSKRKDYKNPQTLQVLLCAIKHYYQYLVYSKQRKGHPCKYLQLKDKKSKDIQLQELFTTEELALLLERKERYSLLKYKNKIMISLLIYQGLTSGEIVNLKLKNIDLDKAEITIISSTKQNSRTLKLKANQIMWFYKYINEDRPRLNPLNSEQLIIGKLGTPETTEGVAYLIQTLKPLFLDRNLNPKTIRQSVITNLLKQGNDIRLVQVFAGHKTPSTTEKYKQSATEELKTEILKYHPLG